MPNAIITVCVWANFVKYSRQNSEYIHTLERNLNSYGGNRTGACIIADRNRKSKSQDLNSGTFKEISSFLTSELCVKY